jgi:diguanylate cyclase (GGDEF)-like protein
MGYLGRISIVIIYVTIVLGWHAFYFLLDFKGSYVFMIQKGLYKLDLVFIPLLSPFFWWLGLQYDKAKFLSQKDALTGLYNRRYISQITPKLLTQMDKRMKSLTISGIDCNNFKQINDRQGHKVGDQVLTNISEKLLACKSKKDIVARWGGDEFLIVSPSSDLSQTKVTQGKVEEELCKLSRDMGFDISVSIGIAVYPNDAKELKDLLIIADHNMYECKKKKRKKIDF